jgi:hypothetical protein
MLFDFVIIKSVESLHNAFPPSGSHSIDCPFGLATLFGRFRKRRRAISAPVFKVKYYKHFLFNGLHGLAVFKK